MRRAVYYCVWFGEIETFMIVRERQIIDGESACSKSSAVDRV